MKLVSWNVNGIRACVKKGFLDYFNEVDADIFCIQETKLQEGQIDLDLKGHQQYWHYAEKKGYSGTAVFSKQKPLSVSYGLEHEGLAKEGRVITLEFEEFYLINVYTPNSQRELLRLDYRMLWEDKFRNYAMELDNVKPVIICGDLNVAHQEIDLKNPKSNKKKRWFFGPRTRKNDRIVRNRFFRYVQIFLPRENSSIYLVVLYQKRQRKKCWLAY